MFPQEIDGAKVLFYTDKTDFGIVADADGKEEKAISYLAIAQKKEDPAYYLMLCDADFALITDHAFPAMEWCKTMAGIRYPDIVWHSVS